MSLRFDMVSIQEEIESVHVDVEKGESVAKFPFFRGPRYQVDIE